MSYSNKKVTSAEITQNYVKSAPDTLTGDAQANKNVFDKLIELFIAKYNSLIDNLDANDISATYPIKPARASCLRSCASGGFRPSRCSCRPRSRNASRLDQAARRVRFPVCGRSSTMTCDCFARSRQAASGRAPRLVQLWSGWIVMIEILLFPSKNAMFFIV